MTTYKAKIWIATPRFPADGDAMGTIGHFLTYAEASARCDEYFAETGQSAWVSQETPAAAPTKVWAVATH